MKWLNAHIDLCMCVDTCRLHSRIALVHNNYDTRPLCCVVLCCVLSCVVLSCVVLCCVVCCVVLCCVVLCCVELC